MTPRTQRVSGHVFRVERKRGPVWYAKYRLGSGRQVQRMLGPAWTERGRPPAGHFTKRAAEDWLRDLLDGVRRGTVPGMVETGATFADAAEEYLRFAEQDRGCKPSTIRGYRSVMNAHLLPVFGQMRIEDITVREIERWRSGMTGTRAQRELSNVVPLRMVGGTVVLWYRGTNRASADRLADRAEHPEGPEGPG